MLGRALTREYFPLLQYHAKIMDVAHGKIDPNGAVVN